VFIVFVFRTKQDTFASSNINSNVISEPIVYSTDQLVS